MENIMNVPAIAETIDTAVVLSFVRRRARDDGVDAKNNPARVQIALYLAQASEDGITVTGLRQLATAVGVAKPELMTLKTELIRAIQRASQHRACFRANPGMPCSEKGCQWRGECKKIMADWQC